MELTLYEIGRVCKPEDRVCLELDSKYWPATQHLEHFSHLHVLWWISGRDNSEDRQTLVVEPPRHKGSEPSGVFACRSPSRPNPVGLSIVQIKHVDSTNLRIHIDQIDADDGSPIIDIKPYLPSSDKVEEAQVAPWFEDLEKRYSS